MENEAESALGPVFEGGKRSEMRPRVNPKPHFTTFQTPGKGGAEKLPGAV